MENISKKVNANNYLESNRNYHLRYFHGSDTMVLTPDTYRPHPLKKKNTMNLKRGNFYLQYFNGIDLS